ncbi:MAG: WD40 repeat domain-containing protein [Saprospiraceae bacterium]|nr:WD40 repeat domain-containing protein [Saprospiraceae bacterium]
MRIPLLGVLFLFTLHLSAQKGEQPYFIQQAIPPAPEQKPLDCFQRNLEEGLAAQKRGDCRLALRWFRDAESCPEVLKIPGRAEEIKTLIAQCTEKPSPIVESKPKVAATQAPLPAYGLPTGQEENVRRRFQPSRQFLQYDKPECFDITCKEAARAYAGGYWDDAAALYRAAKNCTDADQADRMEANRRIAGCKAAAQNELRQKEQDAVRQARHALAANRANDANMLLRDLDRSLAYRLADFANEYIAPEDNDACRQAMFNAVYHTPSVHSGLPDDRMQVPFCYQLGDNLDSNLYVRFLGKGKNTRICAFAPSRRLLFEWDAQSLEPDEPVQLEDTTMVYMDAVPDGRTLLFMAPNAYLFWRNPREVFRLPVRSVSLYCFSADGRIFFYLDPQEMAVYALDLSDAFATRKGYAQRATPEPTGIQVDFGILQMAGGNGTFWLGYLDSLVVYNPQRNVGRLWGKEKTVLLGYRMTSYMQGRLPDMQLDPLARIVVLTNDNASVYFDIPEVATEPVMPTAQLGGRLLSIGADAKYIATDQANLEDKGNNLFLFSPETKAYVYSALIPKENAGMQLSRAEFSPNNQILATTTLAGKLVVWDLTNGNNEELVYLDSNQYILPSADGSTYFIWRNDSLMVVEAERRNRVLQYMPAPTDNPFPSFLVEQNWIAYRTGHNTVVLTDQLGRQRFTLNSPGSLFGGIIGDFSPDEQYYVYPVETQDSVAIINLTTGQIEATQAFGGPVNQVFFVQKTGELLVVHEVDTDNSGDPQTVIKLWNPSLPPGEALRSVRLQQYETREVAFSKKQGLIAFTDGIDIRVFQQNDLLDEIIRIRQNGTHMVSTMQFHPDGGMLAAGYEDGSIIFWDIATGQARFTWAKRPIVDSLDYTSINYLRFADNGRRLEIYLAGNKRVVRNLEVSLIRAAMQTDFRKLVSFLPSQIREYNLEEALDYPNNFARLAASGDLPLIRSFFDYFQETALYSNNIQRVGNSCDRAASLFSQLEPGTQAVLRPILLAMFEDYHWKLLLRNQVAPAQKLADAMRRDFDNPIVAVRAGAHSALLRGDIRSAANLYVEWALKAAQSGNDNGLLDRRSLDSLHNKVLQLQEYNLLQPEQMDCLCGLFGQLAPFDQRCKDHSTGNTLALLDAKTRLRWRIFQQLNAAQTQKNNLKRVQMLESALNDTRQLQRLEPTAYQRTVETVMLALGKAYSDWAFFEQRSDRALSYYLRAIEYLSANSPFQTVQYERTRLLQLSRQHLLMGNIYQNRDELLNAIASYRQGLQTANQLLQLVETDLTQTQRYRDILTSVLQTQLGMTNLMQGNTAAANQAFENAQNDKAEGIHRLYFGHENLVEGNEIQAFLEYGNIRSAQELGLALFQIEQIAWHLPDKRRSLMTSLHQMRSARLATRTSIDSTLADYYWAYLKTGPLGAQMRWDSTIYWSSVASQLAKSALEKTQGQNVWQNLWLNAQLNQAYFLLFSKGDTARFSKVIELSEEAESYFAATADVNYYQYRALIKTNLAHAYWLRNQSDDRQTARRIYKEFLDEPLQKQDAWEVLLKDFRDLHDAGVDFPELPALIRQIQPAGTVISAEDWKAMGVLAPD